MGALLILAGGACITYIFKWSSTGKPPNHDPIHIVLAYTLGPALIIVGLLFVLIGP